MSGYCGAHGDRSDPLLSPLDAPDDLMKALPPVYLLANEFDPLLDDTVAFAHKLQRLEMPYTLKVLEGTPHGFLNFKDCTDITLDGHHLVISWLQQALRIKV